MQCRAAPAFLAAGLTLDAVGQTFTVSPGWLFIAGLITAAVAGLGMTLLFGGMARARRRRVALAQSRRNSQDMEADRDRLAAEEGIDQPFGRCPS